MSKDNSAEVGSVDSAAPPTRARPINEDWTATILGLALLVLALAGVIPEGLVP